MKSKRNIALYLRCSTSEQNVSLQRDDLHRLCSSRYPDATITEYVDEGQSGSKQSRPALNRMLADMRRGRVDVIAVWRYDRLGRSLAHLVELLEEFHARGVQFVSYSEGTDTATATGRLLFNICASFAEFERQLIRERVLAGQAAAKRAGHHIGRFSSITGETRAHIEALRAGGASVREIASQLGLQKSTIHRIVQAATA